MGRTEGRAEGSPGGRGEKFGRVQAGLPHVGKPQVK